MWALGKISEWFCSREPKEESAPILGKYRAEALDTKRTPERIPDPKCMTKPAEYYAQMHSTAVSLYDASPRPSKGDASLIYACQVHAQWGLIYSAEKAIPFALDMLKSSVPEAREDGAAVLSAVGKNQNVVDALIKAFWKEYEATQGCKSGVGPLETIDSIIIALGNLKNNEGIQPLARVLKNPDADGDTQWIAMESLGKLVHRRFGRSTEPLQAALEWLNKNGHG